MLIAQEPDGQGPARWVSGIGGYANDHVEASLAGIRRRAIEVGCDEIAELAEKGELIGSVMQYHFPHSQRRLYEKMPKFPKATWSWVTPSPASIRSTVRAWRSRPARP